MKLTPLDIHHKEFHHALRGYSEEEVDTFLDEVADEFERLFKENIDLSEKLEASSAKVRDYQSMEVTLNNTMVSAQRSAEQIVAQANEEASTILGDAEVKAKEVIHSALTDKQRAQGELVRIKQAEEEFRARFRALLETHLSGIEEIDLPADVNAMIGETQGAVVPDADVDTSAQDAAQPVVATAAAAVRAEPAAEAEQKAAVDEDEDQDTDSEEAEQDDAKASAVSVESMSFGELDPPDLVADDFGEVREFETPSLEAFGEPDDDVDIEEID